MVITQNRTSKIIPVAGGKGGVGKTELCANLAVRLGQLGYRTVAIDLDLGGSNLHSTLGIKNKNYGIGNYLSDRKLGFEELLVDTPYDNLSFVPGDVLVANTPNLTFAQKRSLLKHIESIDADYVLLDLGSGANNNVVDFFLGSNSGIVVSSPHVGAIVNAYSFLKNTTYRFLMRAFSASKESEKFIRQTIKERQPGNPTNVQTVIHGLYEIEHALGERAERILKLLQPLLILNMVRSDEDLKIADSLRQLVSKNLSFHLDALGYVAADEMLIASHRAHNPHIIEAPDSLFAMQVDRIAQKIVQSPQFPSLPLDTRMYRDSYELMHLELRQDLDLINSQAPVPEPEAPPEPSNDANTREFIEILSAQKQQIQELKNTVRVLTLKGR